MRTFFIACLFFMPLASHAVAEKPEHRILLNTLENYITPAYQHLAETTHVLSEQVVGLCREPSPKRLQDTRAAFYVTVDAWSSIEWFRIGPVLHNNYVERFFFFPDRKSRGLRQIQAILVGSDEAVIDAARFRKMSVALQGLGALDFVLFDESAETLATKGAFRCQYASSISSNVNHIATVLSNAWQQDENLRMNWVLPSSENPFFRTDKEAMNVIVGTIIHGLEAVKDTRLGVFLREKSSRDRPKSAPLWRSGATMKSIVANLEGLERLFVQSQIETLLSSDTRYLEGNIRFKFEQSIKTAKELDAPVMNLLSNPNQREKLEYFKLTLNFLIDRLSNEFAPAARLAAGFSFGDGD